MKGLPHVLCIDVGGPTKIGWADALGNRGSGPTLDRALIAAGDLLSSGESVALGFEAPIWTPRRGELTRITSRRGGVETLFNRAWSAGAGTGALGAALALMPWSLSVLRKASGPVRATTNLTGFLEGEADLLVWEAFVSGAAKAALHQDDAGLATDAFVSRWPMIVSDVPPEPAINHAAVALHLSGFNLDLNELGMACLVVAATGEPVKSTISEVPNG